MAPNARTAKKNNNKESQVVVASASRLKELQERSLKDFDPFATFIDGYHIAENVYIIALGINAMRQKKHLAYGKELLKAMRIVCNELLSSLEHRGLCLEGEILYVADGGKEIIKALKERHGEELIHQRCAIHKDRNIQAHLPKKYRKETHRKFKNGVDCALYKDAKEEIKRMEKRLKKINPSVAESLLEGPEELLTVHRLEVPTLLRKSLYSTNPIESMLSQVSHLHGRA